MRYGTDALLTQTLQQLITTGHVNHERIVDVTIVWGFVGESWRFIHP